MIIINVIPVHKLPKELPSLQHRINVNAKIITMNSLFLGNVLTHVPLFQLNYMEIHILETVSKHVQIASLPLMILSDVLPIAPQHRLLVPSSYIETIQIINVFPTALQLNPTQMTQLENAMPIKHAHPQDIV